MLGPVLVIGGAAAAVAAATVVLRRRRRDVWRSFAARHRLEVRPRDGGPPDLEGEVDGRPVAVRASGESSDTGVMGVEVVELSVVAAVTVPPGLEVRQRPPIPSPAETSGSVVTGDDAFDRLADVRCEDEDAARQFLDRGRREALTALLDVDGAAGLDGARLFVRRRRAMARLGSLEADLALLGETAEQLEA